MAAAVYEDRVLVFVTSFCLFCLVEDLFKTKADVCFVDTCIYGVYNSKTGIASLEVVIGKEAANVSLILIFSLNTPY